MGAQKAEFDLQAALQRAAMAEAEAKRLTQHLDEAGYSHITRPAPLRNTAREPPASSMRLATCDVEDALGGTCQRATCDLDLVALSKELSDQPFAWTDAVDINVSLARKAPQRAGPMTWADGVDGIILPGAG